MKLRTKKILAREFLMVLSALLIGILAFIGTYIYNYFDRNEIIKIEKSIARNMILSDSLSGPYSTKRLFDSLVKYQNYNNNYNAFKKQYSTNGMIDTLFNGFVSAGLYTRSKDEFYDYYFPFGKPASSISLNEKDVRSLTVIVQRMLDNQESDQSIKSIIKRFKVKNAVPQSSSLVVSTSVDSLNYQKSIAINDDIKKLETELKNKITDIPSIDDQFHLSFGVFLISIIPLFLIRYLFYSIKWSVKTLKQKAE
jgi:hypothetical protein